MNIVLLSGGSGKRLWPLSNEAISKQFLRLLKDGQGNTESMVQRVYRQIKSIQPSSNVFVSSNLMQKDILNKQLHGVELILEPSRRDTYAAIVLISAYLYFIKGFPRDEHFLVLPIDVFAEDSYFRLLSNVDSLIRHEGYSIGLLGAEPTYPSEKYGYILSENGKVSEFHEKPDASSAGLLIKKGALWNCGVFALNIGYILDLAQKQIYFDSYETLLSNYEDLPKISFDYEVAEKEPSIGVVKYSGIWKDLGTWNTLTDEMDGYILGKDVLISEDSPDTHVLNMLDIPVITLGTKNTVIVASHDGILVSEKSASARLKPYAEKIEQRPMYEQRRWGNYRVLEYKENQESKSLVKHLHIDAGKSISYQYHTQRSEVWIIVSGKGILTIDGIDSVVSLGSVVQIPIGSKHKLLAATDLDMIEVQYGSGDMAEEDIVRVDE